MLTVRVRENFGAIVQVEIQLPLNLRQERQALGTSHAKVAGDGLIDTGADVSAFDLGAASRAGLERGRTERVMTVLGPDAGAPRLFGEIAIPGFGTYPVMRGRGFDLSHLGLVAVIGRDVLRHGVLVYNGREGWATLSRDVSHTKPAPASSLSRGT